MSTGTMSAGRALLRRSVIPAALLSMTAWMGALALVPQAASASTPAASSGPVTGPIVSGWRHTKCVDDLGNATRNDTPIVISDCNGSPEQAWTIEADGTIQINGKCMDGYRDQKRDRAMVELWTCHGGANQQWQAVAGTLVNPVSHKCLDD